MSARNYAALPGPGDFLPTDEDDGIACRAADLLEEFQTNAAKIREADESWSGTLDGDQYSEIESALADLADVSADRLLGSSALERVLRLARVCAEARGEALLELARDAAEAEARAMDYDHAERAAWAREDAE